MVGAEDFWKNSRIAVIGAGSWGTGLAQLAAQNCLEVRLWFRDEEQARSLNATRMNAKYLPGIAIDPKVQGFSSLARVFEGGVQAVIWALPSAVTRQEAKAAASYFKGDELVIHATKGVESPTLKRVSEILEEELPCRRIGAISGPNLAQEIAQGEPAATVVASVFAEVCDAGQTLLTNQRFRAYRETDIVGVEWAGVLKNILAIAAGASDGMKLGSNTRALLISRGIAEIVRFGKAMGAKETTFLGLAGVGDILATCTSPLSRNYQVGYQLAHGKSLEDVLAGIKGTAEGIRSARSVYEHATSFRISMPITEGVCWLLDGKMSSEQILKSLMARPI